jgi:CRP-like cAMP-binding protein
MGIEDDIVLFERIPTLALLGREALRMLAIGADSRYVHGGSVLFREGELADCGYTIQDGSFNLTADRREEVVAVGQGALLGELALIIETRRPVTATAREPSTVIRIPRSLFLRTLEGYPDAALRLRAEMDARIDRSTSELGRIRTALSGSPKTP